MRITIRLNDTETQQLHAMVTSENSASENTGEFIRLLLAREWNRRKGLPKPEAKQFQTAFRIGRPNWEQSRKNRLARGNASDT